MTITEVMAKKEELEIAIFNLINTFEEELSGELEVTAVELERAGISLGILTNVITTIELKTITD